jgi:hypothetical protein
MAKTEVEKNPTIAGPPRRITAETRKAETKLINFENARRALMARHADEIMALRAKRLEFIDQLPNDVCNMLIAGGVITEEEVTDARAGN